MPGEKQTVINSDESICSEFSEAIKSCIEPFQSEKSVFFCICCTLSVMKNAQYCSAGEKAVTTDFCEHLQQESVNVQSIGDTIQQTDESCGKQSSN